MFEKNSAPIGSVPRDFDDMGDKPNNFVDIEDQDTDSKYTIEVLAEQHKDFAAECKHGLVVDYIATEIEGDK